jgi:hypothetical protein
MHIALEIPYEFNYIVDVTIEVERACGRGTAARVPPPVM